MVPVVQVVERTRRTRWPLLAVPLTLFLLITGWPALSAMPNDREVWFRLDGAGITVITNGSEAQARRTLAEVQSLRRALATFTSLEAASPVPTVIFLFADEGSMVDYKHLYRGEPASLSGAFYPSPHADFITMNGARRGEARLTVFHEVVHSVVRNNLAGIPLWFEEGLAELFSTFTVSRGKAVIGRQVPWHLDSLGHEPILLDQLLEVDSRSPLYNEFDHQGPFYSRSWELVHYLLLGNAERRQQALRYLALLFAGETQSQAFDRAFDVDYRALEEELRSYRQQGFRHHALNISTSTPSSKMSRLPYAATLTLLGELLAAQADRMGDAKLHFDTALEISPGYGAAISGLGFIEQQERDWSSARALYRRAIEASGGDFLAHYRYGSSLAIYGRGSGDSTIARARQHLQQSLDLEPSFVPAWAALADLEMATGGNSSRSIDPPNPAIAIRLLLLHARHGNRAAAERLVQRYFTAAGPADAATRKRARAILARMQWLAEGGETPDGALLR